MYNINKTQSLIQPKNEISLSLQKDEIEGLIEFEYIILFYKLFIDNIYSQTTPEEIR